MVSSGTAAISGTDEFLQDLMISAMTGDVRALKFDLFRLVLRAATLEGKILAVLKERSENIAAIGVAFGPGVDFLGRLVETKLMYTPLRLTYKFNSEAQSALGAEDFFNALSEETKKWIKDVVDIFSIGYVHRIFIPNFQESPAE